MMCIPKFFPTLITLMVVFATLLTSSYSHSKTAKWGSVKVKKLSDEPESDVKKNINLICKQDDKFSGITKGKTKYVKIRPKKKRGNITEEKNFKTKDGWIISTSFLIDVYTDEHIVLNACINDDCKDKPEEKYIIDRSFGRMHLFKQGKKVIEIWWCKSANSF